MTPSDQFGLLLLKIDLVVIITVVTLMTWLAHKEAKGEGR